MRIGYCPYSEDFHEPGDRRRFCAYARRNGLQYEIADPSKEYDLIYLTVTSNLTGWLDYIKHRKNTKLVFELIDSYFSEGSPIKNRLRGLAKYVSGVSSRINWNFRSLLEEVCRESDAVVCSTHEQKEIIRQYCPNTEIILDYFDEDLARPNNYVRPFSFDDDKIHIAWEGLPYTLKNVLSIKPTLNRLGSQIVLHVVTDPYYYKFSKRFIRRESLSILESLRIELVFHAWNQKNFLDVMGVCDLAIVPIDLRDSFSSGKPENKLVLLWKTGIPVLTSPTPSYKRAMDRADLQMYCKTQDEWEDSIVRIGRLSNDSTRDLLSKIASTLQANYSSEALMAKWDALFDSLKY